MKLFFIPLKLSKNNSFLSPRWFKNVFILLKLGINE